MKWLRRLAVALVVLCALAVAIDWVVGRFPQERRRALLERELSDALDREVRLGGALHLSFFPRPALEATDVSVGNAPGSAATEQAEIRRLRLVLAFWPLLLGRVELVSVGAEGLDLRLEPAAGDEPGEALAPLLALTRSRAAEESSLQIRIGRIRVKDARVEWRDPEGGGYTNLQLEALRFSAGAEDEPVALSARGTFRGGPFSLDAKGGTLAGLRTPKDPWPLSLDGRAGEATIRLRGHLTRPKRLEGLDLDVEIGVADLGSLLAAKHARAGLGAARLRGHLSDPDGHPGLDRLTLESDPGAELRLRVEGSVRRLADPSGIELDGEIESDQLRFLELLLEHPLPEGSVRMRFQLSDREGRLGASGDVHAESRDGSFQVDLSGRFPDLAARDGLDARLRLKAPSLEAAGRVAGIGPELPALGPVVASAGLRARAGSFGVQGLELEAGGAGDSRLTLRGSVRDLGALRGVAVDVSADVRSLASLGALLRPARSLPDLGPFHLEARLADPHGALAAEHFALEGGAPATLEVRLEGSVADLRGIGNIDVRGHLRARDAALLGSLFEVELPAVEPVVLDGRASGSEQRIESRGTVQLGQSRLEGHGSLDLAGKGRPSLSAELHSAHLRLEDVGLGSARADSEGAGPTWTWRGETPLPFEELRRLDARLELSADRLTAGDAVDITDAGVRIELADGDLQVRDLLLDYQDGSISGALHLDASTPDPTLELRADARDVDLERLGVALGAPGATGSGRLDFALDLKSGGATPDAMRRRLGGRAAFAARDWSAATQHARRFLLGLSRSFLPNLRGEPEPLGCFRGAAELDAGVARVQSLVLASSRAVVVGAGSIDLVQQQWHLDLVPEIRDGGLLEVANAVRVTGPLDDPQFKPIPLNLVTGALRGLARRVLFPASTLTDGAQRVLGPAGEILSPLRSGMGLATGTGRALDPGECVLPADPATAAAPPPAADDSRSPSGPPE